MQNVKKIIIKMKKKNNNKNEKKILDVSWSRSRDCLCSTAKRTPLHTVSDTIHCCLIST